LAALPQLWVDNNELTCAITSSCYTGSPGLLLTAPAYELAIGSDNWTTGPPPGYCTFSLPYAATGAGLQNAITAIEACRTAGIANSTAIGIILDIPPNGGTPYSLNNGLTIPQTSTVAASAPLIIRSTSDATLAGMSEPVCAGGIQDNIPGSTNIGLQNADCTGTNMYYQNGVQNPCTTTCSTTGTITGITTVSVNTTTLCPIPNSTPTTLCPAASGGNLLVALANGYVSATTAPTTTGSNNGCTAGEIYIDDPGNTECLPLVSGVNQTGMLVTPTLKTHAAGVTVIYIPDSGAGSGSFTLANGTAKTISAYNYLQYMPQLQCSASGCVPFSLCGADPGDTTPCGNGSNSGGTSIAPDHWQFEDLAVSMSVGNKGDQDIIHSGASHSQTALTQFAQHIHYRRIWAHGDWTSLATGSNSTSSAITLDAINYGSLLGSQVSQVVRPGSEGHDLTIQGYTYKINNNWIEGESSSVFAGGFSTPPLILNYLPNTDTEERRNHFGYPYSWLGLTFAQGGNQNGWTGSRVRKNCWELKNGQRVLYLGNICDGNDNSGAQNGTVTTLDVSGAAAPLAGAAPSGYYAGTISDLTVQSSIFRNACEGMEHRARTNGIGGVTYTSTRELWLDVLEYAISGSGPGCANETPGDIFQNGEAQFWNASIVENSDGTATATAFASILGNVQLTAAATPDACPSPFSGNCTTYETTGNTLAQNQALCGPSGSSPAYTGSYLWVAGFTTNGGNNSSTPAGFQCAGATSVSGNFYLILANPSGVSEGPESGTLLICGGTSPCANAVIGGNGQGVGYQAIDMFAGQPVQVSSGLYNATSPYAPQNCTAFGYTGVQLISGNYFPTAIGPLATIGSTIWNGTWAQSNAQVTYPWTGPSSGTTDSTGNCILSNTQGGPYYTTIDHHTFIGDGLQVIGGGPGNPQYVQNHAMLNSIWLSKSGASQAGIYNSAAPSPHEGTPTEQWTYDVSSATFACLVFPGRTAANYTEYQNNPSYPNLSCFSASCSSSAGCSPPATWAFPADQCGAINFYYPTCSGSTAVPLSAPDYHYYALTSGSSYHNAASDGSDIGTRIPNIDAAPTKKNYNCTSVCGSPGPFPD